MEDEDLDLDKLSQGSKRQCGRRRRMEDEDLDLDAALKNSKVDQSALVFCFEDKKFMVLPLCSSGWVTDMEAVPPEVGDVVDFIWSGGKPYKMRIKGSYFLYEFCCTSNKSKQYSCLHSCLHYMYITSAFFVYSSRWQYILQEEADGTA